MQGRALAAQLYGLNRLEGSADSVIQGCFRIHGAADRACRVDSGSAGFVWKAYEIAVGKSVTSIRKLCAQTVAQATGADNPGRDVGRTASSVAGTTRSRGALSVPKIVERFLITCTCRSLASVERPLHLLRPPVELT